MSPRSPAPASAEDLARRLDRLRDAAAVVTGTASVDRTASREVFAGLGELPPLAGRLAARGLITARQRDALVHEALRVQEALRTHARDTQAATFSRVQEVLPDTGSNRTPSELLEAAPADLCTSCDLDRALISRVEGSSWVAGAWRGRSGAADPRGSRAEGLRIALRAGLVETEVVRRRAPALVPQTASDARVHADFTALSGLRGYVVAPVVADDRVIGLVHADVDPKRRGLTSVDRDMTRLFADRFGRAYEGAVIAERVDRLRERLRLALDPEDQGVAVLDPTVVRFARASTSVAALTPVRALSAAAEDSGEDALTAREHEVLALLATGATNLQIADQLVLSESTVKSHVKRILRKLPAANRAEAAYRYLRTTGAVPA